MRLRGSGLFCLILFSDHFYFIYYYCNAALSFKVKCKNVFVCKFVPNIYSKNIRNYFVFDISFS